MSLSAPSGPDLAGVVEDANAVGLRYVVIGGFSVIAHGHVRATRDSDLLVADGPSSDEAIDRFLQRSDGIRMSDGARLSLDDIAAARHLRVSSRHGIIDLLRSGKPPLDFETVAANAIEVELEGQRAPFASLRSLVGFKRLADRSQDRADLEALERIHGELPIDPIPGLDT
jgi:hypothetical protein